MLLRCSPRHPPPSGGPLLTSCRDPMLSRRSYVSFLLQITFSSCPSPSPLARRGEMVLCVCIEWFSNHTHDDQIFTILKFVWDLHAPQSMGIRLKHVCNKLFDTRKNRGIRWSEIITSAHTRSIHTNTHSHRDKLCAAALYCTHEVAAAAIVI